MAPQDERIRNLYEGKIEWKAVEFPYDPEWEKDTSYTDQCKQYHSMYRLKMPLVPALMTYCEMDQRDEPRQDHSVRISYRSMVLEPLKWVLDYTPDGNPINGSEAKGEYKIDHEEEETIKFHSSIEFSSDVGISGCRGPVQASASLKASAGASWAKSIKVTYKRTIEPEQGCNYQPTRFYAKLLCKAVRAKAGDFLVHGTSDDGFNGELVTTNPYCSPVKPHHIASDPNHGCIKSVAELGRLYDACGKDVFTGRHSGGKTWAKASVARLKVVVDPVEATLYVTGAAYMARTDGFMSTSESKMLLQNLQGIPNDTWDRIGRFALQGGIGLPSFTQPPAVQGTLADYRGLYGKESELDTEKITYSPGDLVKVWKVLVKAKV
ncbi:hypothetical protein BGZ89_006745, partial [Linnemannia elongata]